MKHAGQLMALLLLMLLIAWVPSYGEDGKSISPRDAFETLRANYPQAAQYLQGDQITRVYGTTFGNGASPEESADQFRVRYSRIFGVEPGDLSPESILETKQHTLQLMYDRNTGLYKFTLVYYSQYKDGLPVFRSDLRLLVRNEANYPLVEASNALKNLGNFAVDPILAASNPDEIQRSFLASRPSLVNFDKADIVVWAGYGTAAASPSVGVRFIAWDTTPATEKYLFIIDPSNGTVLYQENMLIDVNVTGQVSGLATDAWYAEQCGSEVSRHLQYAKVNIRGGNTAYADSTGNFTITNGGSSPVYVVSRISGRYFITDNTAGSEDSIVVQVTPPGPANFSHNPSNTEYSRGATNGYIQSNVVRDYLLRYAPNYPTISTQVDFPVYVNRNDGYCPGNAWYDYSSINFCRAGSGYPNTAFSTVIHHEYGHHVVNCGGSGQGQYGEGMGDVMGLLITDTPYAAVGFFGDCVNPLRNADNSIQYPCSGEIHDCGQLISGCVWSTRNELLATNPSTYRDIISDLAINAVPMHTGTEIAPDITIDFLTLDDDDGNINNGTPHWSEICAGFGAHNMDCPALQLLAFAYPNGRPSYVNPQGGTAMRVNVSGVGGTPQPNTGVLHYKTASNWLTVAMTQVSPNVYDAIFPAVTCGTIIQYYVSAQTTSGITVNDPSDAPGSFYTTVSGTGIVTIYQDDFSADQGWTGLGGSGEWQRTTCNGGLGNDSYGGPDPAADHSPTSDDYALGNDMTSGTGGDYAASLASTYWVTSPTINCTGRTGISLSFWRWLGVEQNAYDHAYFAVKNSSGVWTNLFSNGSTTIDESAWSQYTYDVSAYANNNATFQIRFGLGATDGSWQYCGWNIDDILISSVACDTVNQGTIAGNVTDSQGNVANCRIHAFDSSSHNGYDTTGANGAYSFNVPAGTYSVTFSQIDHRDTTVTGIAVTANNTTTLNMAMQRLPGAVRGTVTKAPSQPVSNVRVIAVSSGREDTTDAAGLYNIGNLAEGTYGIRFVNIDYRDTTVTNVSITPGDTTVLNVQLTALPGWITGTVRDTAGTAINNVLVRVPVDSTYTNSSGYYSLYVPTNTYSVLFRKTDYRDTTISSVAVTPNDTTNVSPRLRPVNHAPVVTSPAADTATEHQLFSYLATATDQDGQTLTKSYGNYPGWLTVHGDTIVGTPGEGNGNTSFRIIASDGELADTQIVALTVIAVNDPPVITSSDTATAAEHVAFTYTATATDPEGTTPTIGFSRYPSWLAPSGNQIHGTPPEAAQDTSFMIVASDGILADTMIVSVNVLAVNDAPVITSPDSTIAMENVSFRYVGTAYDPEGLVPTISFIRYPSWTTPQGDTLYGTPTNANHDTVFTVIASDGVKADTQIVVLQVVQSNDPPYITSLDTATAVEHILFSYAATASDPDGTTPAISFSLYPGWLTVVGNTISGMPGEATADTSFRVIASDGALADTMIVSLTVVLINDPPVITSTNSVFAIPGEYFDYLATAYDPEGATPAISFESYPFWMTPNGDHIQGTPPIDAQSTSFMIIATDGMLNDTLIVTVIIQAGCVYMPGDINNNGAPNGIDVVFGVNFFKGLSTPPVDCGGTCPEESPFYAAGDVNGNCSFNGIDITFFVRYLKGQVPDLLYCPDCPPQVVAFRAKPGIKAIIGK